MNDRYLLDTNIVIALFNGEPGIVQRIASGAEFYLSVITVGELLRGAHGSQRAKANLQRVRALAASVAVLACTVETAEQYAAVKHRLRLKGTPLPENDVWIAATAQQHSLSLVSRDRHFREIEELRLEQW